MTIDPNLLSLPIPGVVPGLDPTLNPELAARLGTQMQGVPSPAVAAEALRVLEADGFEAAGQVARGANPQQAAETLEQMKEQLEAQGVNTLEDQQILDLLAVLIDFLKSGGRLPGQQGGGAPSRGTGAARGTGGTRGGGRSAPSFSGGSGGTSGAGGGGGAVSGAAPDTSNLPQGNGTVGEFLDAALAQNGDRYVFGAETNLNDANPDTFDCSELVQWAAAQAGVNIADGSSNQAAATQNISVDEALRTPGALLFRPGHVAISLGDGRTIEARGRNYGVGIFNGEGRFTSGGLIPGMQYG